MFLHIVYVCCRLDGGGSEEGPGEGVHEVRAAQGDLAGQLRAHLRIRRLQKQTRRTGSGLFNKIF